MRIREKAFQTGLECLFVFATAESTRSFSAGVRERAYGDRQAEEWDRKGERMSNEGNKLSLALEDYRAIVEQCAATESAMVIPNRIN